jgi:metal-responsive CopG/Arc/MetJ family transcriptional regulator
MARIKIDSNLFARVKKATEAAGYSSVDEFITHIIEKELAKHETADTDEKIAEQLRGLGYIE